jgi:hypothetical protein
MRLSQIIDNEKYRDTTEIMLFHGTSAKWLSSFTTHGIKIVKLTNKKKDFGQGFYLTTRYWQARDYANRIAKATNNTPLIIGCVLDLKALRDHRNRGLVVDDFNEQWLHTIIRGRFESESNPLSNDFDWIYGRCGDGHTDEFEEAYKNYKESNEYENLLRLLTPNIQFPHYDYDQLWLGSYTMIKLIKSAVIIYDEGGNRYEKIPVYKQ